MSSDPNYYYQEDLSVQDLFKYVDSRYYILKSGYSITEQDSYIYYKLRHNLFKTVVCYYLGIASTAEKSFSSLGLCDSNRTPDYLSVDEDNKEIVLVEYTVTNLLSTAIVNKESYGKYDPEVTILRDKGYRVDDYYLCLSLDKDINDLFEMIMRLSKYFTSIFIEDLYQHLSSLKDDLFYLNWYLNDHMPELLTNESAKIDVNLKSEKLDVDIPFPVQEKLVKIKSQKNIFIRRKVKSKLKYLSKSFTRKSRSLRYKLVYNVSSDTLYTQFDEDGLIKSELMNLIQTEDNELFEHLDVRGALIDLEEPFKKYGSDEFNFEIVDRVRTFTTEVDDLGYIDMLPRRLERITKPSLVDNKLSEIYTEVPKLYQKLLNEKNTSTDRIITLKKNPFIFVPTQGLSKTTPRVNFSSKFSLTDTILRKSRSIKGKPSTYIDRSIDYDKIYELESKTSKLWSKIKLFKNVRKYIKKVKNIDYDFDEEQLKLINEFMSLRSSFTNALGEATRTQYSNRVTIEMSSYKTNFPLEMEHYGRDKSKIIIHPYDDFSLLLNKYQKLIDEMFLQRTEMTSDSVYSDTEVQGIKLKKNCEQMREFLDSTMNKFRKTDLAHTLQFYSNMCYSLMYYSSIKLNKNDFCVDTLGYNNCLLIVKGGRKISTTKRSRLFKIFIPVSKNTYELIETSSIEVMEIDKQLYVAMPWRQLKEDYLKTGLELYANFSNYFVSSSLESNLDYSSFAKYSSLKILSLFSQKRKMEIWLSNFRYLFFNSTGQYSDVLDLVDTMIEYNYDSYFYLMQNLFINRYTKIYETSQKHLVYDIFWDITYDNFDLLSEKFDEAVFMTKAPVDNYNEHLLNLRTVLETHKYFKENYPSNDPYDLLRESTIDISSPNINEDLYKNDFVFDPKLCFLIGTDCSRSLLNNCNLSDVKQKFASILSDSYTDVKTSKGMRSDTGPFWGEKGFDVIFSDRKFSDGVLDLIHSFPYNSRNEFEFKIRQLEENFMTRINSIDKPQLQFDIKDKIGSKGRREIYVMTLNSKVIQQPIERLMNYLCTMVPNELINKKSHIRPKVIHQKIFETVEPETKTLYLTLDCRKWAPRSNLWKYVYFILGMKDVLPVEFINYFLQVWFLMFHKKIRIQSHYIEVLKNNKSTKDLIQYLDKREDGDYELQMPYSFMMGIYNYLSSLFHAASQNFFNTNIASTLKTRFNLFAHSDDSGGTITYKSVNSALRAFRYYEHFQKACNHLLSKKKSVISDTSFEIISIMYAKRRLIPVTYKFITNISFNPTGSGWYNDICSTVSLVVDIFQNGGTYLQAYSAMLTHVELLRKAYHLPRSKLLSAIPLHFGGVFNMHPIHIILLGSCAQEVMLDVVESPRARNHRIHMYYLFNGEYIPGRGSTLKYRIPYIVKHLNSLNLSENESEIISNLSLINEKRTLIDAVKYFNDLRKMNFEYALLNVDKFKLLYSTMFFKVTVLRDKEYGSISIADLAQNFMGFQILGEHEKRYFEPYSNEYSYMLSSENIAIDFNQNTIESKKACKPMLYNTFSNLGLNLSFDDVCHLILHNLGPDYAMLNKNQRKWESLSEYFSEVIPGENREDKLKILNKLERADLVKLRSAYLFIPSNVTIDTTERFWTFSLLMCSRRYYVSSQKPQFYTLEQFEFWRLPYECLKHHYFMLKLAITDNEFINNYDLYCQSIQKCKVCENKNNTLKTLEHLRDIANLKNYSTFSSNLPFAIYKRPQLKGQTSWYGTSDFALYTRFGRVEHYVHNGLIQTDFYIYDDNFLDQIWHLYKIFCDSRGITIANIVYGPSGEQTPKVQFSDLNMPFVSKLSTFGMMLNDSRIYHSDYFVPELKKIDNKIYFDDEPIDLNIYNVSDINNMFYEKHNLSVLKDLFITKMTKINEELLINSFKSSKLYNMISLDDFHKNHLSLYRKYVNVDMLGSPGSFTRALCMANELGLTSYKSSVSHENIDLGVLERQNISQIPVIDLYNSSSMLRLNQFDYITLNKLANDETLDSRDIENLKNLVSKCGLSSGLNTIVLFKEISKNFDSSALLQIEVDVQIGIIQNLFETIHKSMANQPIGKATRQFQGTKREYWNTIKSVNFQSNLDSLAYLMVIGLFRGQSDDLRAFWNVKRKNSFTMMMNVHHFAATNLYLLIFNMLNNILKKKKMDQIIDFLKNLKYYITAKPYDITEDLDNDIEDLDVDENLYQSLDQFDMNPVYISKESESYEDDIDAINENDELEDPQERIFDDDEEDLVVFLDKTKNKKILSEYTITNIFSHVKIYTLGEFFNASWLGAGNYYSETVNGIIYNVSEYPGKTVCPKKISNVDSFFIYKRRDDLEALNREAERSKGNKIDDAQDVREVIEESLSDRIKQTFADANLYPTKFIKPLIPEDKISLSQLLSKVLDWNDLEKKISEKRANRNYLPGFTGVLKDSNAQGELLSLFGDNHIYIYTGQVKVAASTAKTIKMLIKNIFHKVSSDHKAILVFLLSVIKEAIDATSDSWFTDKVFYILDKFDSEYENQEDEKEYIAPDPGDFSIFNRSYTYQYEAYDELSGSDSEDEIKADY